MNNLGAKQSLDDCSVEIEEIQKEIKEVEINSNINSHEKRVKEILGN